jgi:RNA polymerase sigma factor (sigma-70 family)
LVLKFTNLPAYVVKRLRVNPAVARLEYKDAVQVGFLGLLRAAELWDDRRGTAFMSYAFASIRSEVMQAALSDGLIRIPSWVYRRRGNGNSRGRYSPAFHSISIHEREDERGSTWELADRRGRFDREDSPDALDALRKLKPVEQDVIRRCVMDGEKLAAVGRGLGVSRERVRQIRERGLARLRRAMAT